MPEKYLRRDGLPILLRHTGRTTLPQDPPLRGSGRGVVCLHDAGLQSSVFEDLLRSLEEETASTDAVACGIAFDLPGHGRSGSLDALPSIEAMAEMARWVGDWCQLERPLLVGHGMGALIALEWARSDCKSVGGLVLCGAGHALAPSDEAIETMRRVTLGKAPRPFDPKRVAQDGGPELMRRAYMEGIQTDPRATLVDLEASRNWASGFRETAGIRCPVRIVCGAAEEDRARQGAAALEARVADATLAEIPGAAHFLPLEKPGELANEIRRVAEAL